MYLAQVLVRGRDAVNATIGVDDFWDAKKIADSRKEFTTLREKEIHYDGRKIEKRYVSEREQQDFEALTENEEGPRTARVEETDQASLENALEFSSADGQQAVLAPSRRRKFSAYLIRTARLYRGFFMSSN